MQISNSITLENIYARDDMEEDSGMDSKQETLSTTSTNSVSEQNESNRPAAEQKSSLSLHSRKSSNVFIQLMRSRIKKSSKEAEILSPKTSKSKIPVPIQKKEEVEMQTLQEKSDLEESNEMLIQDTQLV